VPTVDKNVIAKERFSLGKETVRDEASIDENVRKEQVDLEKDGERQ
jgi:stress response protein YsnF